MGDWKEGATKSGAMRKEGSSSVMRVWNRRYFSLVGSELRYAADQDATKYQVINIAKAKYVRLGTDSKRPKVFHVHIPDERTFAFEAPSADEARLWVEVLDRARAGTAPRAPSSVQLSDYRVVEERKREGRIREAVVVFDGTRFLRITVEGSGALPEEQVGPFLVSRSPFVLCLVKVFREAETTTFILEEVESGLLWGRLAIRRKLGEMCVRFLSAEILLGLAYLHARGIHCAQLSRESILLGPDGHVRIAPPVLAYPRDNAEFCGSIFAPPELDGDEGDVDMMIVDFYSFGAILYELLCGLPPWLDRAQVDEPLRWPAHVSAAARDLIRRLLLRQTHLRLRTEGDIRIHRFYSGVDWGAVERQQLRYRWSTNCGEANTLADCARLGQVVGRGSE